MYNEKNFYKFINKVSNNKQRNVKLAKKYIEEKDLNDVFWEFCNEIDYDKYCTGEDKKLLVLEALLESGADPNYSKHDQINNFIHLMVWRRINQDFFMKLLDLGIRYKINFSKSSEYCKDIVLDLIKDCSFPIVKVTPIFKKFVENGYDVFLTDYNYNTLDNNSMKFLWTIKDKKEFIEEYKKIKKEKFETRKNEIIKEIKTKHPNLDYEDKYGNTLLHILVESYCDEDILFEVIKHLIVNEGIDVNAKNDNGENFLHVLTQSSRSKQFAYKLIMLSLDYFLEPNAITDENETILNNYISNFRDIEIIPLYKKLKSYGLNVNITNNYGESIIDIIKDRKDIKDKCKFIKKYIKDFDQNNEFCKEINRLLSIGKIIKFDKNNIKNYKPIYKDISFDHCCCNIFTSKTGGGKTKTLEYLSNYLSNEENQLVFSLNSEDLIKNSNSISGLRELFLEIMNICEKNNIILCVDDMDKLYNLNASRYYKEELNILIYHYIFNKSLKLMFTMDINKYNDIIDETLEDNKNMFYLEEENDSNLKDIIEYKLFGLRNDKKVNADNLVLNIMKEIIFIILNNDFNNIDFNKISKVKILTDIIDDMYDYYKLNNKNYLELTDLIYGIKVNKYIINETKDIVINEINNIDNNLNKDNVKKLMKKIT